VLLVNGGMLQRAVRPQIMVAKLVAPWPLVPLVNILIRRSVVTYPCTCTRIMVAEIARTASAVAAHAINHGVHAVDLRLIHTILNHCAWLLELLCVKYVPTMFPNGGGLKIQSLILVFVIILKMTLGCSCLGKLKVI
jgi:hypothetical protein